MCLQNASGDCNFFLEGQYRNYIAVKCGAGEQIDLCTEDTNCSTCLVLLSSLGGLTAHEKVYLAATKVTIQQN